MDALEDRAVPASLAVSDATIVEGDTGTQNAVVAVRLSAPSSRTVTVDYRTANVTAVAGSDYVAVSGRLTFNPGVTSQSVLVPVLGDRVLEPNEGFFVNLRTAKNATLADSQGIVTILDNDPHTVRISDTSGLEGNAGLTPLTFTVTLSADASAPVTVNFATQDGTAVAGEDYLAASGTLTFAPGEGSKDITVQVLGDGTLEPDETLVINLSGATNAVIADGLAVGLIVNDDPRTVSWNGGGGDFNWNNPLNWDVAGLPGPFDDVVVGADFGGTTVHYGSGTTSVHSLASRANLDVSGGSLTLSAASSVNGDLTVSGGSLTLIRATSVDGNLTVSAGYLGVGQYLRGSGELTVGGQFTNSGAVEARALIMSSATTADRHRRPDSGNRLPIRLRMGRPRRRWHRPAGRGVEVYVNLDTTFQVMTFGSRVGDFTSLYTNGLDYGSYYDANALYVWIDFGGGGLGW